MFDTSQYLKYFDSSSTPQRNFVPDDKLIPETLVRFSKYFDIYMGDYTSSDIAEGLIGTIKYPDQSRADHYIIFLGDNTPVSVHKQNISLVQKD